MDRLVDNFHYAGAVVLFCIGLYSVIMRPNIIKKIIGLNLMESAVFFLLVSLGYLDNGIAPIYGGNADPSRMVNPIPQALILTGIVVAVSTTAVALALVILLYRQYGTLDVDALMKEDEGEGP